MLPDNRGEPVHAQQAAKLCCKGSGKLKAGPLAVQTGINMSGYQHQKMPQRGSCLKALELSDAGFSWGASQLMATLHDLSCIDSGAKPHQARANSTIRCKA